MPNAWPADSFVKHMKKTQRRFAGTLRRGLVEVSVDLLPSTASAFRQLFTPSAASAAVTGGAVPQAATVAAAEGANLE